MPKNTAKRRPTDTPTPQNPTKTHHGLHHPNNNLTGLPSTPQPTRPLQTPFIIAPNPRKKTLPTPQPNTYEHPHRRSRPHKPNTNTTRSATPANTDRDHPQNTRINSQPVTHAIATHATNHHRTTNRDRYRERPTPPRNPNMKNPTPKHAHHDEDRTHRIRPHNPKEPATPRDRAA